MTLTSFPEIVLFGIAALAILGGLAFFLRPRWLMAWFKGMFAIGLIVVGLFMVMLALNLRYYQSLDQLTPVADLKSVQVGPQTWRVTVQADGAAPKSFTLKGDQWQLDARIVRFSGFLSWIGLKPMYQLDRLSGRYVTLEQAREGERTVFDLSHTGWVDIWAIDRKIGLPFVEARYGSATFMPLKDGATYRIQLSGTGLVAEPTNDIARKAVNDWF